MLTFLIAGARPNFMKIAPIARAFDAKPGMDYKIIHTGQHDDANMSQVFFDELGIRKPDYRLNAGEVSHGRQTAAVITSFEDICQAEKPDLVLVVGDANSTLAAALTAKKMKIRVAHVEAGLRSFDRSMPEEINRLATDAISDLFFVTEPQGMANLKKEGKPGATIFYVGHVMVDNLYFQLGRLGRFPIEKLTGSTLKARGDYGVVTLHRPANVDDPVTLTTLFATLGQIAARINLIFPIHPRTRKNMEVFGIKPIDGIFLLDPLPYMSFLNLWKDAKVVLTDSGGLQEETTALNIPCLTLRENTERPVTVSQGTNALVGTSPEKILEAFDAIMAGTWKAGQRPHFWDGRSAERIAELIMVKEFKLN